MDKSLASGAATSMVGSYLADQWSLYLFGVPLSVVLAAFAGAFFALSWQRKLPPKAKCAAVWLGTFAGAYLTPLVMHYSNLTLNFELAVAFAIGLVSEPALHRLYQRIPQLVDQRTKGKA